MWLLRNIRSLSTTSLLDPAHPAGLIVLILCFLKFLLILVLPLLYGLQSTVKLLKDCKFTTNLIKLCLFSLCFVLSFILFNLFALMPLVAVVVWMGTMWRNERRQALHKRTTKGIVSNAWLEQARPRVCTNATKYPWWYPNETLWPKPKFNKNDKPTLVNSWFHLDDLWILKLRLRFRFGKFALAPCFQGLMHLLHKHFYLSYFPFQIFPHSHFLKVQFIPWLVQSEKRSTNGKTKRWPTPLLVFEWAWVVKERSFFGHLSGSHLITSTLLDCKSTTESSTFICNLN